MKTKTKVISLLILFVLLVSTLIVGVLAVINTDFKVSGNIQFKAKGIEATIENTQFLGTLTNGTVGEDKLTDININTDMSLSQIASEFNPWNNLEMAFGSDGADIVLKLRITNNAENGADNYIYSDVTIETGVSSNCTITAVADADNSTVTLISPKSYVDYTITFSIPDKEVDARLIDFAINFNLQYKKAENFLSATDLADTFAFTYDDITNTASVTKYDTNLTGDVVIPEFVKVDKTSENSVSATSTNNIAIYKVTALGENAFTSCKKVESITIPKTISSISNAFSSMYRLVEIKNLSNLTIKINSYGLSSAYHSDLRVYKDGESNIVRDTESGYNYFYDEISDNYKILSYNGAEREITIPTTYNGKSLYTRHHSYEGATDLVSITIPQGEKSIKQSCFEGCTSLINVSIPTSVTVIEPQAFMDCASLKSIVLPTNLQSDGLGPYAFYGCVKLSSISIPSNVHKIGTGTFGECESLTNIRLPNNLTEIGQFAFERCYNLKQVSLPSTVRILRDYAFSSGLETLTINGNITTLGSSVFGHGLKAVTFAGNATQVNDNMFQNISSLITVNFNSSITKIGTYAFKGCRGLISITIPSTVTSIGTGAFDSLSVVTLNSSTIANKTIATGGGGIFSASTINLLSTISLSSSSYLYKNFTTSSSTQINGSTYRIFRK